MDDPVRGGGECAASVLCVVLCQPTSNRAPPRINARGVMGTRHIELNWVFDDSIRQNQFNSTTDCHGVILLVVVIILQVNAPTCTALSMMCAD